MRSLSQEASEAVDVKGGRDGWVVAEAVDGEREGEEGEEVLEAGVEAEAIEAEICTKPFVLRLFPNKL
jgi:hypothetical protein